MEELTYKDLSETELDTLKDIYISSRVNSMTESDLRKFVKEIIIDQIKGTVGNAEEKEAWEEMKDQGLSPFFLSFQKFYTHLLDLEINAHKFPYLHEFQLPA